MHKKEAEFHKAKAALHKAFHEHLKAKHESMADDSVDKAHYAKAAGHHKALADLHEGHAAYHETEAGKATTVDNSKAEYVSIGKTADGVEIFKLAAPKPAAAAPAVNVAATVTTGAAPNGIEGMVAETTKGLVSKSLEMLQTDPTVQDEIRKMVLEGVRSALGGQIVPTTARSFFDQPNPNAMDGLRMVPRAGGPSLEKAKVSAEMDEALAI